MAYRQLCAVTFAVLGWVTVGCGSGSGAVAVADVTEDQPPANPDRPTNNVSDRTSNPDQPPANPDQPPNDSNGLPSTGGSGAEGICRAFCDSIKEKDCKGPSAAITRALCNTGCVLSAEQQACATEIAAAISCLSHLNGLCTEEFTENDAAACRDTFDAADACDEAHQPPDDDGGPPCSPAGGCECGNACQTCGCLAGTNTEALAACVTGVCAQ